jgi:hypothetical protein
VTYRDPQSILKWAEHIKGAARLLEWRGEEQLNSSSGLYLFRLMRSSIVSLNNTIYVPPLNICDWEYAYLTLPQLLNNIFEENYTSPTIVSLSQKASSLETDDIRFADSLATKTMQLSKFCADMRHGVITDTTAKIKFALLLDAEIESWAVSVPPSWRYKSIAIPAEIRETSFATGVYGMYYHVYKDLYLCNVWNNWRAIRLIIHEIILDNTSNMETQSSEYGTLNYADIAARSEHIMLQLQADIFASVPYHFGTTNDLSASTGNIGNFHDITPMAGHILMWPLFLAADCRYSPPDLRDWVIMCLQKIGHQLGVNQALGMALLLQKGIGTRSWIQPEVMPHVTNVGSWETNTPSEQDVNFSEL